MGKVDSKTDLTTTETLLLDTMVMGFQMIYFYKEDLELSIKTHCIVYNVLHVFMQLNCIEFFIVS